MKRITKVFIPLATLTLFTALLPTLCSTKLGKDAFLSLASKMVSAHISAKDLHLSWIGSQKIEDLAYEDVNKGLDLTFNEVFTDASLLKLIFSSKEIGNVRITEPKVLITSELLSSTFSIKPPKEASFLPTIGSVDIFQKDFIEIKGNIHIQNGSLEIKIPSKEEIVFSPVNVQIHLDPDQNNSSISLKMDTLDAGIKGNLSIEGTLSNDVSLQITSEHFPLKGVDQIVGFLHPRYKGLLVELAGPSLDMDGSFTSFERLFEGKLTLQSQNIKAGLQMSCKQNTLELTSPSFFQVSLTPEGYKKLSVLEPSLPQIALSSPSTLLLNLESLYIPIQDQAWVLEKASFSSSFSLSPYFVTQAISAQLKGKIFSEELNRQVQGQATLQAQMQNNVSQASVLASCTSILSDNPSIHAALTTQKIPTSIVDSFLTSPISGFLGSWVEGSFLAQGSLKEADVSLQLTTPLLSIPSTPFLWSEKTLVLKNPVTVSYQLTPSVLETALKEKEILLHEPVQVAAEIKRVVLADAISVDLNVTLPDLFFDRLYAVENYTFPSLSISLQSDSAFNIHVEAKNSLLSFDSSFKITDQNLILTTPLIAQYTLHKQDLSFTGVPIALKEDSVVKLTCTPTTIPLQRGLNKTKIQGKVDVSPLHLQSKKTTLEMSLENISSEVSFIGSKELIDFSFQAALVSTATSSTVKGTGSLKQVLSSKIPSLEADLKIENLSLGLLQYFYASPLSLAALLGDTLSSSLHIEKNSSFQLLKIEATSPLLQMKGSLVMQDDKIFLPNSSGPFTVQYTLTPEGYKALTPSHRPFALSEKAVFSVSIADLDVPYLKNSSLPDLASAKIQATAFNDKVSFQRKQGEKESILLEGSKIYLQKKPSEKDLSLRIDSKAKGSSLEEGSLQIDMGLSSFLTAEGEFILKDLTTSIQAKAISFPSSVLDIALAQKRDPFAIALGPSFNAELNLSLQNATGPVAFSLQSAKAHLNIEGKLAEGNLSLVKDAKADVLLTPELGKFLLKTIGASQIQSLYAPSPITAFIAAKGFSFPLETMDLSKLQAPFMRIDFGKVYCKNEGPMASILKQLKSKEKEGKEIQIWFAPLDLHINQGVVDVERTELLLDQTFDMALWGEVNLPGNYVDMGLGLTAQALNQAFGLNLPKDYIIKIPIKGPLDNVQVKGGSAASKITALLLWQSQPLTDALGPFGAIKKAIPPPGGSKAPPAKRPFPWE